MTQYAYVAPDPVFQFVDDTGAPLSGGLVFTYLNNTTTKANTYVDGTSGTPNTNPIVLDSYGTANIWLPAGQLFTFVISPSTDTDPPTNPIKTVNNISAGGAIATINFAQDAGSVNAISAAVPGLSALVQGIAITVDMAATNTGPTTLNASGTGPKPVILQNGGALGGAELQASGQYLFQYTGSAWMLLGQSIPADKTISQGEILAGITPTNWNYAVLDPRRYGATFTGANGVDDTVALNRWVQVMNATPNPVSTWPTGASALCAPLMPITASNVTLNCYATLLANPLTIVNSPQITFSGSNVTVRGLTLNGNQLSFTGTGFQYNLGVLFTGSNITLEDVSIENVCGWGLTLQNVAGGTLSNVSVVNCAAWGVDLQTCSYINFTNCTWSKNGWGFKVTTLAANAGVAFNFTIRFRSHHVTLTGCSSTLGGLDGMNVNEGSYAIKFVSCLAWQCGDAGFSLANDSPAGPGQNEACYDIAYVNCESYNNWGGGLVAEGTSYNLNIVGGRYYNNGRGLGTIPLVASMPNGIYIGNFSQGVVIDRAKTYDDRQFCVITGVSAAGSTATLTATAWGTTYNWGLGGGQSELVPDFTPTAAAYPRVALYNQGMVFQGYASIVSESAGQVIITTAGINASLAAPISSIAANWFVTQRIQHNGVYCAAGVQAVVEVDGWGQLPGPNVQFGYKVYAYPANGQNVINKSAVSNPLELLVNPSWESEIGGAPGDWQYTGAAGTPTHFTTPGANLHSAGCLAITGGNTLTATATLISNAANFTQDCWVEYVCTITTFTFGGASITLSNAGAYSTTVHHPGTGTRQLKIGMYAPVGSSFIASVTGAAASTAYFDEASLRVHYEPFDNRDYYYPTRNLAV